MTRVVVQRGHSNASNSASQSRQTLSAPPSTTTSVPSSANSSTSSHPQFTSSSSLSLPFSDDGGVRGGGHEGPDHAAEESASGNAGEELNGASAGPAPGFDGAVSERQYFSRGDACENESQAGRPEEAWDGSREAAQRGPGECLEDVVDAGRGGRASVKGKELAEDGRGLNFGRDDDRQGSSTSEDSGVADLRGAEASPRERIHADDAAAVVSIEQTRSSAAQISPSGAFPRSQQAVSDMAPVNYSAPDQARPNSSQSPSEAVGCSYLPTAIPPAPWPSSSRRGSWLGSSGSAVPPPRGGSSRRVSRVSKPSRNSPNSSRPSSPRAYGEGDGYNSGDEHNSRSSGSAVYENNEERERQFEVDIRFAKGFEVRRMAEDGNCLFRAVAYQVYGDAEMYEETRQMCIDYMEKERDHFSQFVTESFTAYCKRKRRDKVYGNNLEIQAMAEMYNRPIHIYSYSAEPINIFHGSYETDLPPIRLSYHRGNHYNSLIDPGRPAVGAGLGFVSLRGTNVDQEQVKAALKAQQDQQIDKALLAEGRFYSDIELTEQEIQRMVMEASRAEYFEEEKHRQYAPWSEETSTSAAAEPSSSARNGSPKSSVRTSSLAATSTTNAESTGLTSNVRMLMSMGFSYLQVMEACSIFGDDVNNILCYLLETENSSFGDGESMYRKKGKAAERS